ncbi:MAG: adenylylsulfate kinase [Candidatus Nitrosomirales archaeon]|jgi:adenylylsulfate kinase
MNSGFVIWLTGLSGSGKTTITDVLAPKLQKLGFRVERLDGDEVRRQLSPDLGFSKEDRETHAKRVVYVSKLLARNGVIVIVSLISPYRSFRAFARQEIGNFLEVYVKCSIEICAKRDPKGLYKKAFKGEIKDMTGLQDPYEEPLNPEVIADTERESPESNAEKILCTLRDLGYLADVVIPWGAVLDDTELKRVVTGQSNLVR